MSQLIPLQDNIIVEPLAEEITKSGIIIPDTVSKEKPMKGTVIAVGPGRVQDDGSRTPMDVKEGDVIIFTKYAPTEIKIDGKELYVMDIKSALAIEKN